MSYHQHFINKVIQRCFDDKIVGSGINVPADTPLSTGTFIPFRSESFSAKPPEQIDNKKYRQHRDHLHGIFLSLPVPESPADVGIAYTVPLHGKIR